MKKKLLLCEANKSLKTKNFITHIDLKPQKKRQLQLKQKSSKTYVFFSMLSLNFFTVFVDFIGAIKNVFVTSRWRNEALVAQQVLVKVGGMEGAGGVEAPEAVAAQRQFLLAHLPTNRTFPQLPRVRRWKWVTKNESALLTLFKYKKSF